MDASPILKRDWVMTKEAFDKLLFHLDGDREFAAIKYEELRSTLIRYLRFWGSPCPEDHADEAITRVARKIDGEQQLESGKSTGYFCRVARFVLNEFWDKSGKNVVALDSLPRGKEPRCDPDDVERIRSERIDQERRLDCLQRCMNELPAENRSLIQNYHQGDGRERITVRNRLAEEKNIPLNALRIRVHRVKHQLEECLDRCLNE